MVDSNASCSNVCPIDIELSKLFHLGPSLSHSSALSGTIKQ